MKDLVSKHYNDIWNKIDEYYEVGGGFRYDSKANKDI